jgi:hypothetical protein
MKEEVSSKKLPGFELTDGEFASYTRHQVGVVLTILEASIPEGRQLEAAKSLVKNSLHRDAKELAEWVEGNTDGKKVFPFWSDK